MNQIVYTVISTLLSICLAIAWSRKSRVDLLIKIFLSMFALWGILESLVLLGYVVKA